MSPSEPAGVGSKAWNVAFSGYFVLLLVYLLLPLLIVIPVSFGDDQWLQFPPERLSLRWYKSYFSDSRFVTATVTSFWIACVVSALATVIGTVTALGLSRARFRGKNILYGFIIAPLIIPIIIFALALFILFNQLKMTGSVFGLILAHVVLALPFPVLIVSAALQQFDTTLERAGRILGATPFRVFWHITLPYLTPAALASAIFSFFVSFDELVIALFITGRWDTLPKRIWSDLRLEIDPTIAAVAAILIAITLVGITGGELLRRWAMARSTNQLSMESNAA
jgi:putative spermidine/putrescine transport system permease protein